MAEPKYNVPVIPPDLRREETIRQICDALSCLDKVEYICKWDNLNAHFVIIVQIQKDWESYEMFTKAW